MSEPTKFRCPRCLGGDFRLHERIEVSDTYLVVDGIPVGRGTGDDPTNIGFYADCVCGHSWTPRRSTATAIIDAEVERRRGLGA